MATRGIGLDAARWLVTAAGCRAVDTAAELLREGTDELRVAAALLGGSDAPPPDVRPAVLAAAVARLAADRAGHPHADRLLLTTEALEQASRPGVAAVRAARYGDAPVVDLCCGAGLDTAILARRGRVTLAVDRDPVRVLLARHNLRGLDVGEVRDGDALDPGNVGVGSWVHADPSRRRQGRRARGLRDYLPSVPDLLGAHGDRAAGIGVAVSPALDWGDPGLPARGEVEFVQDGSQLVEATLWTGDLVRAEATAVILPDGHRRIRTGAVEELPAGPVGAYLLEVAPAAVRARVHDAIGAEVGARRVDPGRALLTCDDDPGSGPWWRHWAVEAVLPARPRNVRRWLSTVEEVPLALTAHGLEVRPEQWWQGLGRPARGPVGRRLHLVRTSDGGRCIVARDLPTASAGASDR